MPLIFFELRRLFERYRLQVTRSQTSIDDSRGDGLGSNGEVGRELSCCRRYLFGPYEGALDRALMMWARITGSHQPRRST
jgi:hypothetical protein